MHMSNSTGCLRWSWVPSPNSLNHTKQYGTLADVVIAAVWRAVEPGSIPGGTTIILSTNRRNRNVLPDEQYKRTGVCLAQAWEVSPQCKTMVTLVLAVSTTDCDSVSIGSNPIRYPKISRLSIMDNTASFYLANVGSIPAGEASCPKNPKML